MDSYAVYEGDQDAVYLSGTGHVGLIDTRKMFIDGNELGGVSKVFGLFGEVV